MKRKHVFLGLAAIVALLIAGEMWRVRSTARPDDTALHKSGTVAESEKLLADPEADAMLNSRARLAPPNPMRRFTDFTPEQRVQFARQGHGPGG